MARSRKSLDSDLSLIAFISLLSVLICSLLLTVIWVQIGTMDVKQAVGGQAKVDNKKLPSIWANIAVDGSVRFHLQDVPSRARKLHRQQIAGLEGRIDTRALATYIEKLKKIVPDIRTALIQPKADVVYEEIIVMMDHLKKQGMVDLGVVPL